SQTERNEAFLKAIINGEVQVQQALLGPYEIKAGSIMPAASITGLYSDLPGQVTEPVYAPVTGQHLLVP
ncbi:MAG: TrbI/VirB10 family protein, partial [Geminicoccaceae bacterium]